MKKLYTATGILKQKHGSGGRTYPYVSLGNQEYVLNMQEMVLWTILNWRILSEDEIKALYDKKTKELGIDYHRSVEACQYYLVQRGLIAEGCGETGADALYDLISIPSLSEAYIISPLLLSCTPNSVSLLFASYVPLSPMPFDTDSPES